MYCNDKLKLNKFRKVAIPTNKEYFTRYGRKPIDEKSYGSAYDSTGEPLPMHGNKVEEVAAMEAYDRMRQAEEDALAKSKAKKAEKVESAEPAE